MAPSIAPKTTETIRHAGQFGNLVGLRPISFTTTPTNKTKKTRVVRITEHTWEKLKDYSHHYHDQPISYDEIFQELLDFYNEKHEIKYF